jgi:hypothetical protein
MCRGAASAEAVFEATVDAVDSKMPHSERRNPDGTVTVSISTDDMTTTVRFKEIRALRGAAPEQLVQRGTGSCRFTFEPGVRYLVVLTQDGDGLGASRCGLTRRIEEAAGLLQYIDGLDRASTETLVWGRAVHSSDLTRPPIVVTPLPNVTVSLQGPTTGPGMYAHQFDLSGTSPPACAELTFVQTQQ